MWFDLVILGEVAEAVVVVWFPGCLPVRRHDLEVDIFSEGQSWHWITRLSVWEGSKVFLEIFSLVPSIIGI